MVSSMASTITAESVLSLSPTLQTVNSTFTPASYAQLNAADLDFASGGIMLVPASSGQTSPPVGVAIGKDAVLYLLKSDQAWRQARPMIRAHYRPCASAKAVRAHAAARPFYKNASGNTVFVQIDSDVLAQLRIVDRQRAFADAWPGRHDRRRVMAAPRPIVTLQRIHGQHGHRFG